MKFRDFVEINPRVRLIKGEEYPYVEMADLNPSLGYVSNKQKRIFKSGGSKFEDGDTLFARITPCLENGKIARFKSNEGEKAFGSTEFFVFRAKDGISDPDYIFFLSKSSIIKETAEKSMTGASGRQRADVKAVEEVEIDPPNIKIQQKIASILSAFDDLIENNTRRIQILEEMARLIYKEWFVHFRYPGHEKVPLVDSPLGKIPKGWEVERLEEVCDLVIGQSPKSEFYNENGDGLPFHQGVKDFGNRYPTTTTWCTIKKRVAEEGDILFSVRAPVGRINIANTKMVIGRGLHAIRSKYGYQVFIYHQLKEKFKEEDTIGGGTIFKSVTKSDVQSLKLIVPITNLINFFEDKMSPIFRQIKVLTNKNIYLKQIRDLLLPKLISGKINV